MKKVGGKIAYYRLEDWWVTTFSEDEREYIDDCYQPMGAKPHTLTQGNVLELNLPAPQFLNGLSTWFRNKKDSTIAIRIHEKIIELGKVNPIHGPGYFDGRHFTTYVWDFENLKRIGDFPELEKMLIELVKATEEESAFDDNGVAPAYYSELAILYRKQKEYAKEVSVLERFARQKHAPGVMPAKLMDRLVKAKRLLENQSIS